MYISSMSIFVRISFIVLLVGGIYGCQPKTETITIGAHQFDVRYALTEEEQAKGLMFVEDMPEDQGMVFPKSSEQILKFWMKNTLIPLDMLFFDKDMRLVHIERSATPHDLTPRGPDSPVCVVVELNGGVAKKRNIQINDILSLNRPYKCLQSPRE